MTTTTGVKDNDNWIVDGKFRRPGYNEHMERNAISRSEELFSAAINLPLIQREPYVSAQAADDPELCKEVLFLIKQHTEIQTSNFILDRAPAASSLDPDLLADIGEKAGDTIGHYRLLEQIGEGGMGVVYMAEQLVGVRRKVALKVIKLGMDTRQVVARFEVERQAMALFDHPNIARVLDAGSTESGRPYFVMELVRGTSISRYVNKRNLDLEERLQLFTSVCNAVHHAHQKGIIHRDLKPSNILVTQFDGVPVAKVIDFGIAKAIGQNLTDKTLFTRYSAMIGTPQYMSPEQAEMTGMDVDTRSDIYSLGVLLYEIITGTTPLDKEKLKKLNPLALFETIRDCEFETPSNRVNRTRQDHPELDVATSLPDRVRNELDWIVMKALSRDRTKRYASASEMADDIQRYLNKDAVRAVPPSQFYRLKAYAYKHRTAVLTVGFVSIALVLASIVSSVFAWRANKLNNELTVALSLATENLDRAELAERQYLEEKDSQMFQSAQKIALVKFNSEFLPIIMKKAIPEFEDENQVGFEIAGLMESTFGMPASDLEMYDELGFLIDFGGVCIGYDFEWLTEFENTLVPEPNLALLRKTLSDEDSLTRVAQNYSMELERLELEKLRADKRDFDFQHLYDFDIHDHSPACLNLREQIKSEMLDYRPAFFRILVSEYRNTFGENDRRVSDGLILLAASLIDTRRHNQAESHLREAIALKGNQNVKIENELLNHIRNLRK